jgi:hypothetical protein
MSYDDIRWSKLAGYEGPEISEFPPPGWSEPSQTTDTQPQPEAPKTSEQPPPKPPETPKKPSDGKVAKPADDKASDCRACQDIVSKISNLDREIGALERSNASVRKYGNLQDPNIQKALKEDEAKIQQKKAERAKLEANNACPKHCKASHAPAEQPKAASGPSQQKPGKSAKPQDKSAPPEKQPGTQPAGPQTPQAPKAENNHRINPPSRIARARSRRKRPLPAPSPLSRNMINSKRIGMHGSRNGSKDAKSGVSGGPLSMRFPSPASIWMLSERRTTSFSVKKLDFGKNTKTPRRPCKTG